MRMVTRSFFSFIYSSNSWYFCERTAGRYWNSSWSCLYTRLIIYLKYVRVLLSWMLLAILVEYPCVYWDINVEEQLPFFLADHWQHNCELQWLPRQGGYMKATRVEGNGSSTWIIICINFDFYPRVKRYRGVQMGFVGFLRSGYLKCLKKGQSSVLRNFISFHTCRKLRLEHFTHLYFLCNNYCAS